MQHDKLNSITCACRLNDKIFLALLRKLRSHEFKTEIDATHFIDSEIHRAKASKSFPTIVAIGKNAGRLDENEW